MLDLMMALKENHAVVPILLTKKKNALNRHCEREKIENHSFWYRDIMAGAPYRNRFMRLMKHVVKYLLFLCGGLTYRGVNRAGIDFSKIDIIHTNLNRLDIGIYLSKKHRLPHICHIREYKDEHIAFYKRECISYLNSGVNRFIAISQGVYDSWSNIGIDPDKQVRINNGIDHSNFIIRKKRIDNVLKMVIFGRVEPIKGQLEIVRALSYLDDDIKNLIQLDIWGDAYSDYQALIKEEIERGGLTSQVNFCGYCNDIATKLADYDVGVICSKSEGFGRVTVECMFAGLAVIASDTGANPEIITDGVDGRIYRYGDAAHLAEVVSDLFHDCEQLESLAYAGRKKAESHFTIAKCADAVFKIYQELLNENFIL